MTKKRGVVMTLALASGLVACAGVLGLDELAPRPIEEGPSGEDVDGAVSSVTPAAPDASSSLDASDGDSFLPHAPRLLASKWYHTCAARQDGGLYCFGHNQHGELGDGTMDDRAAPTPVESNPVVEEVATGLAHTCILQKAGVVRCWGSNERGQLGDNSFTSRTAVGPSVFGTFSHIFAGLYHSCALTLGHEVRCWGDNYFGSVGDGSRNNRPYSTSVLDVANVVSLALGGWHACAVVQGGTVYCWGYNRYGQLGYATPQTKGLETHSAIANVVPGLDHVVQVTAGENHTCALRDDDTVWCWGRNDEFALGDGTQVDRIEPTRTVGGLENVVELVAGSDNTCARLRDQRVRCWGRNPFGELATGTIEPGNPVPGAPIAGLDGVTLLTTGDHACAFGGDGALRCWGRNDYGQVGIDTSGDSVLLPTVVSF